MVTLITLFRVPVTDIKICVAFKYPSILSRVIHTANRAQSKMCDRRHQSIVFFDLETTGLDTRSCEIIQLSAICGDKTFNAYTVPVGPVDKGATEVTGLSVNEGRLCHWETPVPTVPLPEVFTSFLAFLRSFPGPVLLAAHNAKFDWVVLARVLDQFPNLLLQFQRVVPGYLDTLLLSRRLHPDLPNHKLSSLVSYFLEEAFDAHNAEEDARVLQQLFYFWNPEESTYSEFITYV